MTTRLDGLGTDVVCWSMRDVLSHLKPGMLFSVIYDSKSEQYGNNSNSSCNNSNSFISLLENVERGHKGYDKWAINLGVDSPFNVLLMLVYSKPSPRFLYQNKLVKFNFGSTEQVFQNNCFIKLTILS